MQATCISQDTHGILARMNVCITLNCVAPVAAVPHLETLVCLSHQSCVSLPDDRHVHTYCALYRFIKHGTVCVCVRVRTLVGEHVCCAAMTPVQCRLSV